MIELNKAMLVGRLTKDPEMKFLPSGMGVCEMRIAADRSGYTDKTGGERKTETIFINVTAWAKTAEFCNEYFRKGSAIYVEGRLKSDQWKDKDGNNREKISIVADRVQFAETKAEAQARMGRGGGGGDFEDQDTGRSSAPPSGGGGGAPARNNNETTDDLPF